MDAITPEREIFASEPGEGSGEMKMLRKRRRRKTGSVDESGSARQGGEAREKEKQRTQGKWGARWHGTAVTVQKGKERKGQQGAGSRDRAGQAARLLQPVTCLGTTKDRDRNELLGPPGHSIRYQRTGHLRPP